MNYEYKIIQMNSLRISINAHIRDLKTLKQTTYPPDMITRQIDDAIGKLDQAIKFCDNDIKEFLWSKRQILKEHEIECGFKYIQGEQNA